MEVTTKQLVISSLVIVTLSAAVGRYTAPEKIKIEKQVVEVEKKTENKDKSSNHKKQEKKHYNKTTTVTANKDGTSTTTTVVTVDASDEDIDKTTQKDTTSTDKHSSVSESKEVTTSKSKVNLGLMAGVDTHNGLSSSPVYGAYINKPIVGPVTVGAFGMTNGVLGCSIGLEF